MDSISPPRRTSPHRHVGQFQCAQWRNFVTLINGSWRKGAADFIACSRHLIATSARDAFNVMVKSKLDFDDSVARLMHIASNETLCSHVNRLPPCWSTLYYVSQLSESALKAAFADGRIHPGLMRKDAIGLKREETTSPNRRRPKPRRWPPLPS